MYVCMYVYIHIHICTVIHPPVCWHSYKLVVLLRLLSLIKALFFRNGVNFHEGALHFPARRRILCLASGVPSASEAEAQCAEAGKW